jgi:hypothetical protein
MIFDIVDLTSNRFLPRIGGQKRAIAPSPGGLDEVTH